jgi:hypothetical protein
MIARKPKTSAAKAATFINAKAPNGSAAVKLDRKPVLVNIDGALLERIDAMAREMGLNRSAFIINSVAEKLRALEQKNA